MSDYYVKDNSEGSKDTFNKKAFYKIDTVNEQYPNLVDFNFAEKQLYGRVSKLFEPIIVRNYVLELKPISATSNSKANFSALNFVADAFGDLAMLFQKKGIVNQIDVTDQFLSQLSVFKSFESSKKLYNAHIGQYMEALSELFSEDDVKFVTFDKFVVLAMPYILQASRKRPFTLPAYIKSYYCPATVSGLVIEISDIEPSNDEEKIKKFYESKNWEFFLNACATYGFMVDKNIPWRIIADIGSAPMLEYARKYGPRTTNDILTIAYEKAHRIYFDKFKKQFYVAYNTLRLPRYFDTVHVQSDGTKLITRTPLEYSEDEFYTIYDDFYFLDLYCRIRFNEEESDFPPAQQRKIIDNTIELCKIDFEKGLDSFENILNKPFDYIGSLTYTINRLDEIAKNPRPNDEPDVQTITDPIEEIIADDGDGAMDSI